VKRVGAFAFALGDIPAQACETARDRYAAKERAVVMVDEANIKRQLAQPVRRGFRSVQMHLFCRVMQEVRIALQFEGGAPADNEGIFEDRLKRDDGLLPA
jgi:hypothetical protein